MRGTLTTGANPTEFNVELRSPGALCGENLIATPSVNGQFDFPQVKPGHYLLTVKNRDGDVLKEEQLFVNNSNYAEEGTVNVNRLNHQVPKLAQKAMKQYRKCRDRKDEACASRYLNEAIAADGDLVEAYVNRSAIHIRALAWELAVADLQRALRLDPQCALAQCNRAFVAIHRKEYPQAMMSAKAALRSEPDTLNAQYFLALAHVNLGDYATGLRELEKIAGHYAPARLTLNQAAPQRAALERAREAAMAKAAAGGTAPAVRSAFTDERRVAQP